MASEEANKTTQNLNTLKVFDFIYTGPNLEDLDLNMELIRGIKFVKRKTEYSEDTILPKFYYRGVLRFFKKPRVNGLKKAFGEEYSNFKFAKVINYDKLIEEIDGGEDNVDDPKTIGSIQGIKSFPQKPSKPKAEIKEKAEEEKKSDENLTNFEIQQKKQKKEPKKEKPKKPEKKMELAEAILQQMQTEAKSKQPKPDTTNKVSNDTTPDNLKPVANITRPPLINNVNRVNTSKPQTQHGNVKTQHGNVNQQSVDEFLSQNNIVPQNHNSQAQRRMNFPGNTPPINKIQPPNQVNNLYRGVEPQQNINVPIANKINRNVAPPRVHESYSHKKHAMTNFSKEEIQNELMRKNKKTSLMIKEVIRQINTRENTLKQAELLYPVLFKRYGKLIYKNLNI